MTRFLAIGFCAMLLACTPEGRPQLGTFTSNNVTTTVGQSNGPGGGPGNGGPGNGGWGPGWWG